MLVPHRAKEPNRYSVGLHVTKAHDQTEIVHTILGAYQVAIQVS